MNYEANLPHHGQLPLFRMAGRLAVDTFCPHADDGWRDAYYYYNQGEHLIPDHPRLFHGTLGYNGNHTNGDITEPPIETGEVIPLPINNVVELHPRESA